EWHALAKPQQMNFYVRQAGGVYAILRVGFPGGDRNAMEVRHDDEDGLAYDRLQLLNDPLVPWSRALEIAEERGGRSFRNTVRTWSATVVLSTPAAFGFPVYRVAYARPASPAIVDVLVDARTGNSDSSDLRLPEATLRAENVLGGAVGLTEIIATWRARSGPGLAGGGFDTDKPVGVVYRFIRSDLPEDRRTASVGFGGFAQAGVSSSVGTLSVRPPLVPVPVDVVGAALSVG